MAAIGAAAVGVTAIFSVAAVPTAGLSAGILGTAFLTASLIKTAQDFKDSDNGYHWCMNKQVPIFNKFENRICELVEGKFKEREKKQEIKQKPPLEKYFEIEEQRNQERKLEREERKDLSIRVKKFDDVKKEDIHKQPESKTISTKDIDQGMEQ